MTYGVTLYLKLLENYSCNTFKGGCLKTRQNYMTYQLLGRVTTDWV